MTAETVSISDARKQLASIIGRVSSTPVYLTRHGRQVAAIIDARELDRLIALAEDMEDIRAADEALADIRATGKTPIPWEEVKAELGLT